MSNYVYVTAPSTIYRKGTEDSLEFIDMLENPVDVSKYVRRQTRHLPTTITKKVDFDVKENADRYDNEKAKQNAITMVFTMNSTIVKRLASRDYRNHYKHYQIPKKTGGLRDINEPDDNLKSIQKLFVNELNMCMPKSAYHCSAYAYVKRRNILNCLNKHKANGSKWFLKLDLHDFFGSTTLKVIMQNLERIYPFNLIRNDNIYWSSLERQLVSLMLDGVLPQGSPASPAVSNLIMIPFDYEISKILNEKGFVYTRYADDILISHKKAFDWRGVIQEVKDTFAVLNYPYVLNEKKTRYGSINGRNWNLGLMLNKDNQITIGWRKKKEYKAMLHKLAITAKNAHVISCAMLNPIAGLTSFYEMIDKDYTKYVIRKASAKHNINVDYLLKFGEIKEYYK